MEVTSTVKNGQGYLGASGEDSLLEITDYLVSVGATVSSTRDMYPEVFAVGGFEDELVEVNVVL